MKYKINAVIVTCNRCELLKRSLESLLNQTYELNKIIIINNASTDGTKCYLDSLNSEVLDIIHKEINEGGAGGFYYGIKEAYDIGCDFVWIMDDDTISAPESLEKLIESYEILNNRPVGFLASNVLYKDGNPCFMNICRPEYVWNEFIAEGIVRITHCSFVAMLIPIWVIKDVGFPIREYFIWGDDGEYSTRILQKYEGYLCGKSIVYHYMNENVGVDIWNVEESRIDRFFYFYRNWMCTNKMRSSIAAKQFEKDTKALIKALRRSNTSNKNRKIKVIKKGIHEGKKFEVKIQYPDERNMEDRESAYQKGIKYCLFRIFRHFAVKYDIKTQGYVSYCKELYRRYVKIEPTAWEKIRFLVNGGLRTKLYDSGNKTTDLQLLLKEVKIKFCRSKYFAYSVDAYKTWKIKKRQMANCTIEYELLLNHSLDELEMKDDNSEYVKENNQIVEILKAYCDRLIHAVNISSLSNRRNIATWIGNLKSQSTESFEEALQRILIMNQIMWQTRHIQMGLGRLDLLLEKYLRDDMSEDYLEDLLADFIQVLHNYYWMKSEEMPGDTGQIIILGGLDINGNEVCNPITYAVIRAIKKLQLPDPKVLLRVTSNTPNDLWKLAADCIATGIGCPLISNDDRVIPALTEFGYDLEDAYNYVTSACWEIIPGKSCEQNNIGVIDFAAAFDLLAKKEDLEALNTWDKFIWQYSAQMCGHTYFMVHLLDNIAWEKDPLMSFFMSSCRESFTDISEGGGKYNNYGILSVGLSNTVNSLINIRKYVYEEKRFTLKELYTMRNKNFVGFEDTHALLKNSKKYFGEDDIEQDAIGLTNWLIMRINETISEYRNIFGGKVKFGLSSPGYIIMGKNNSATFDGRLDYEPYNIHISADDNQNITSLLNFASAINYGKAGFNGNVVDFTMSSHFINENIEKFVLLLRTSIETGVFQIQMNVIDSQILVAAKMNPEKYPNLIVRVWGFSAYFKDLPEEYKDYVIARAIKNETINY